MMNYFSFDELQKKDLLTALWLWLIVEGISFVLFPAIGLINPGARLRTWFLLSVPLGLAGAALISASSRLLADRKARSPKYIKPFLSLIGQFGGWFGLAGIMFPFFTVCVEFFSNLKR